MVRAGSRNYSGNYLKTLAYLSVLIASASGQITGTNIVSVATSTFSPSDVWANSNGDVYFAEPFTQRVRVVTAATGETTTVASGHNALSVCGDTAGNVYFVDSTAGNVGKVDSTLTVTNVAGAGGDCTVASDGAATSYSFCQPTSCAVDTNGDLYVADRGANNVVMVGTSTGAVTLVAGNGTYTDGGDGGPASQGAIKAPYSIYIDSTSRLFVADSWGRHVRKIQLDTGILSTYAGMVPDGTQDNTLGNYSGDGGPAVDAELYARFPRITMGTLGNLFYSCDAGQVVRVIDPSGNINLFAGELNVNAFDGDGGAALQAHLSYPAGMWAVGNTLWVADQGNNKIRAVTFA